MAQLRPKLIFQGFALLAPPLLFIAWVASGTGVHWMASRSTGFEGSLFSANTMLMALVWLGYFMTLINLCFYAAHVIREALKNNADASNRRDLFIVFWISMLLAVVISAFLTVTVVALLGIHVPLINFDSVIVINHCLILGILVVFIRMDRRAFRNAQKEGAGLNVEVAAAWLSVWLVSVPSFVVTLLALFLHYELTTNPDWMLIYDKPEILSAESHGYGYLHIPLASPSSQEQPMFGLFVSGLNVGLIMSSIMVSQIAYFAIQVFKSRNWGEKPKEE
ncbi:MAG: hypothetical protein SGJ20_10835 [Planctomycetota bacterium]|nr:hypothetical protein [Planctomycetota bacterium]